MLKTAVVILNWNGIEHLKRFLHTAVNYSADEQTKIIIADNGSEDDSIKYIKENFPEIRIIEFEKNFGFTGGYNKALEQIEADYFVLLNSDIEVTKNWTQPIIQMMDEDNKIAAVMPKILSYSDNSHFEYAGASGGYIDKFGYPFCRGRIIGTIEPDKGQFNNVCEVFWASGATMFVRASYFREVGGFDDDFFAHMEEIDLCWKFKNRKYKIMVNPNSTVYHVGGGTLPNDSPRKIYFNYRNNLLLLLKNLHPHRIIPIIFSRMFLDGLSSIIYIFELKFSFFFAVIRAHFSFWRMMIKVYRKRKKNAEKQKSFPEIYKKSIVFAYFIRKKKTFNELNF